MVISNKLYAGNPVQPATESRMRSVRPGMFPFLFESCCVIDTQPPLPGTGK